ncbi:iron-hydroxamate ABC transporter substrate-binding protein [Paenibacillus sacheonensis]|uniref:ABC transporter substrate-binding protein n=1 Tax=Paenibacillus sacheonensis TaxID=742054 RepID=A0A7X5C1Y0_9BACL|nr:iron-hydroxamate ABC transporter substrate-binding protein [Paenibacillus sacheonensis]MBM7566701.1 iron complex transport system substrate-binding protein [Paenibacillus sacheonensis]NBC70680.1 ABC transporter substrate-binding protein [Paenibacillus sacheonensis]
MRKALIPVLAILILVLGACGTSKNNADNANEGSSSSNKAAANNAQSNNADANNTAANDTAATGTITYESQSGPVDVPANPQRVVVLAAFAGSVMKLGVPVVGVDSWSKQNPRFQDQLKDAQEVSDDNLEKIIELDPDLIIGLDNVKNVDKLKEIAPTVVYTYNKVDYLAQFVEIGKLLNKGQEAQAWVDDFKQRAAEAGTEIKAKIGENATVSVVESFDKQLYVYGDSWGRGTEILYQEMKLKMPQKVIDTALKDGYYALSSEVLPQFAGDYMIVSKFKDSDNSFEQTEAYKNIPAVKNGRVFDVDGSAFYFNDPMTLDYQLDFFKQKFLGQ